MKKTLFLVLIALLALTVAACGKDDGKTGSDSKSGSKSSTKVTVYSPHQAEIINPIVKEFQDRTKIEVELVTGGTGRIT